MSHRHTVANQNAYVSAQGAMEKLHDIQRQLRACAETLCATRDFHERSRLIGMYENLIEQWDAANEALAQTNRELFVVLSAA